MKFEWDEKKRQLNLRKHKIDFACAEVLFNGPMFFREDKGENYGEPRFLGFGCVGKAVIMVAYSNRDDDVIRIISMRLATPHEKRLFVKFLSGIEEG